MNDDDDNSDAAVGPSSWSFQPFPLCPSFSLYPLFTDFTCSSSSSRRFFGPVRDPYTYSLAVCVLGLRTPLNLPKVPRPIDSTFNRLHFDEALDRLTVVEKGII